MVLRSLERFVATCDEKHNNAHTGCKRALQNERCNQCVGVVWFLIGVLWRRQPARLRSTWALLADDVQLPRTPQTSKASKECGCRTLTHAMERASAHPTIGVSHVLTMPMDLWVSSTLQVEPASRMQMCDRISYATHAPMWTMRATLQQDTEAR